MKIKTLAVAAGVGAPLILTGSASGAFVGITATSKPNEFGLLVVNVYAVFDRPGEDSLQAVAGTYSAPLIIEVIGGTFYNSPFGNDLAPNPVLIDLFPSLAYDSFYTIGKKTSVGDQLVLTAGMPQLTGSQVKTDVAGWIVIPDAPQGNPFDPANSFPGNGQVLIGQFSTADGVGIRGTMFLQFISNGVLETQVVTFGIPTPGVLGMMGVAGLIGTRRRRR